MEGNNRENNNENRNNNNLNISSNPLRMGQIIQVINNPFPLQSMTNFSNNPIIIPIIRDLSNLIHRENSLENSLENSFNNDEKMKIRPLSHEIRDKLGEYKVTDDDISNNLSCAICQSNFKKEDKVICLPCEPINHFFHKGEKIL